MMTELNTTSTESSLGHNSTHNGTHCEPLSPEMTKDIATLLICLFGLVGNGIVLWFLGCRMKRNAFTVYILNLAVTDCGFLLGLSVVLIIYITEYFICELLPYDNLKHSLLLLSLFAYSTSLYFLTAISIERCLSVFCPIWHKIHRPKHLSACLCALLWTFSSFIIGLCLISCFYGGNNICQMSLSAILLLNFPIITLIMIISNLILFIRIQCVSQQHQPGRLYIVILLTVLFFLLFAVPLSAFLFFGMHGMLGPDIGLLLASANSSINPVIYFLVGSYRKRRFGRSVKLALLRAFYEKEDCREVGEIHIAETMQTAT
ncbi:proto-oncogene Mas-like [Alligator sinensis]|uniref:Proto-oncogene Mas-like n=1 Tax=Alligator sinensis TaxID=38654 RepID=A0A3Q0HMB0_ALLSI|nr:proto-oncogene Mas-like [Alligator sinensis]